MIYIGVISFFKKTSTVDEMEKSTARNLLQTNCLMYEVAEDRVRWWMIKFERRLAKKSTISGIRSSIDILINIRSYWPIVLIFCGTNVFLIYYIIIKLNIYKSFERLYYNYNF